MPREDLEKTGTTQNFIEEVHFKVPILEDKSGKLVQVSL